MCSECCSGNSCCTPRQERKSLVIEFLYLDLNTCGRCIGTEKNLEEALNEVSGVLLAAGFDVSLNKMNITSKELAYQYKFISSPTIRVNGKDIAMSVKESPCKDCGDICGDNVDCRVWVYEGQDYTEPPKAMIINSILKAVYSNNSSLNPEDTVYSLPKNLELFFNGLEKK